MQVADPTKSITNGEQRNHYTRKNSNHVNMVWGNVGNQGPMSETILKRAGPEVAKLGPNSSVRGEVGKINFNSEAHFSPSVKGKKVIVRSRAVTTSNKEAAGSSKPPFSFTTPIPMILSGNGAKYDPNTPFLFSTTTSAEMGNQHQRKGRGIVKGGKSRNRDEADACDGVV